MLVVMCFANKKIKKKQQHAQKKVQCNRARIVDLVLEDKLFIPDFDITTTAIIHSTYN